MKRNVAPTISILLLVLAILLIVGAVILLSAARPAASSITIATPVPTSTNAPTATPAPVVVYVTGAVRNPNAVYTLPSGSRVQDALNAAGGPLENADLSRINLASFVHDGDQIHIFELPPPTATQSPTRTAAPTLPGGTPAPQSEADLLPTENATAIVRINTATFEDLVSLPGIGPALAERIIEYRTAHGRISRLDTLMNIRGIGPVLVEQIKDLISFE
ncbi:MAG: helix-hairpin-helix domain-containing protein [Chloroflexi bacterium]|nr:helix-hairpin-helix domain-containing protein [Chloroflexota bacterium]